MVKCPKCNKMIDLSAFSEKEEYCEHCVSYYYLENMLKIAWVSIMKIESEEDVYFSNIRTRLFYPFVAQNSKDVSPRTGAISMAEHIMKQIKVLLTGYPKEDLLFMMVAVKELSAWLKFDKNVWSAPYLRSLSHIFTNIVSTIDDQLFGDHGIVDETDFVSFFVYVEELERLIENVFNSNYFGWDVSFEEMLLTRVTNEKMAWFHSYFEQGEMHKPELIEFKEEVVNEYLQKNNSSVEQIKNLVGSEIEKLFGFSYEDLNSFRDSLIQIAKANNQVFQISPTVLDNKAMEVVFVFEDQLNNIGSDHSKHQKILQQFTYAPTFSTDKTYEELSDPHMDYKFIFRFESIIALGVLDSAESITIFENLSVTDHFIQDIFGEKATKPFKKAQEKLSNLIAIKIALHFAEKQGYIVPMLQKGVPRTNFKMIQGNNIRENIVSDQNQPLGDIDGAIVDVTGKKIILLEVKYYKPAVQLHHALAKDRKIFDDIDKIMARANWFRSHITSVIQAWNLPFEDFKVETVLVTARPNYYGLKLEKLHSDLKYFTYDQLLKM